MKVGIIGAGIAGLSAGCYLQKYGFETEIFEAYTKAGGLCTWWNRNGFTIDGSIRWLIGVYPTSDFYSIWKEIIPLEKLDIHYFDEHCQIVDSKGKRFHIFIDIDKLKDEMLRIAPEDKKQILRFLRYLKKMSKITLPILKPIKLMTFKEKRLFIFRILSRAFLFLRLFRMSCSDYAKRFQNPLLRGLFTLCYLPYLPFLGLIITANGLDREGSGYPLGGSRKLVEVLTKEYKKAGGKIHFNSLVEKIIIENKQAKGFAISNGAKHYFDYVVSAGDGHETLLKLIGEKYLDRKFRKRYINSDVDSQSTIYVSIGLKDKDLSTFGYRTFFTFEEPIVIHEGFEITNYELMIYDFDPNASREGDTLITLMLKPGDECYWIELREKNIEAYNNEKAKILEEVINRLEKQLGNVRDKIVFTDVATPATYKRYTRNWRGGIQGWSVTPKELSTIMPRTIKGLKRFYMAGQWYEFFGGIPIVLMGGCHVAQLIAHDYKKRKIE
jgi:phytoene dehydrogenase-like protein